MEPKDIGLNKNKRNPPSPPPQQPASCDGECCQLPEIKSRKRSRAGLCLAPGEQNTIALPGQGQTTASALAGRRNQPGMGGNRGCSSWVTSAFTGARCSTDQLSCGLLLFPSPVCLFFLPVVTGGQSGRMQLDFITSC